MTDRQDDMHDAPGEDYMHPVAKALFGWVEHKRTSIIVLALVIGLSIGLVAADLIINRHDYLHFAESTGFYALWGFGAVALAVLSGWPLGKLLRRDEDYYGEADTTPQDIDPDIRPDIERDA